MNDPHPAPRDPFYALACLIRHDLDQSGPEERVNRVTTVLGAVIAVPLSLGGLAWLVLATDRGAFARHWPLLLLIAALLYVLNKLRFYWIVDLGGGMYGHVVGSLEGIAKWSGLLLLGPPVLWIDLLLNAASLLTNRSSWRTPDSRWTLAQKLGLSVATTSLLQLTALAVFRAAGGVIPLPGLEPRWLLAGLAAVSVQLVLEAALLWATYLGYGLWSLRATLGPRLLASLPILLVMGQGVPYLASLFAVPLAGIYSANGPLAYLLLILAALLVASLTRQMSRANERARQQAAQLEKLEALGRAILNAPPDASTLPALLAEHVPAMFTFARLGIWVGAQTLLAQPAEWPEAEQEPIRAWVSSQGQGRGFTTKASLPWNASGPRRAVVAAPVLDAETGQPGGGIYVELAVLGQTWDRKALDHLLPSVQGLAAQVASALHQARVYERTLAHQKTQLELAAARRIQTAFLPHELPPVPGWQVAASLEPAREMAGDFYDLIPLPSGKLGLLIADVADKGVGPALYMALSRTLIRTFAVQYEQQPERVLLEANQRILQDAGDDLFVTAFYGVLDPQTGEIVYANAGHNPPWVFQAGETEPARLRNTGMPLGVDEMATWDQGALTLARGGMLFLYTDGATDAENPDGQRFESRLLPAVQSAAGRPAADLHAAVLADIRAFMDGAPQFDDITLVVLTRG